MATYVSGAGDPVKTLRLLWRLADDSGPRRGPKQGLSIDTIVDTAVRLADDDRLDALTMRRLAQELGVAPMTLYTYVPGKAELLDLMLDAVYAETPGPAGTAAPWRRRLRAVADGNRAMFRRHPWAASIATTRPPLGPGAMAKYERELRILDDLGLDDVTMDSALTLVLQFVRASALAEAEVAATQAESSMDEAEWWSANRELFARIFDVEAYPTAARVGAAAGEKHGAAFDAEHAYEFGLERILDGIAALIPSTPTDPTGPGAGDAPGVRDDAP